MFALVSFEVEDTPHLGPWMALGYQTNCCLLLFHVSCTPPQAVPQAVSFANCFLSTLHTSRSRCRDFCPGGHDSLELPTVWDDGDIRPDATREVHILFVVLFSEGPNHFDVEIWRIFLGNNLLGQSLDPQKRLWWSSNHRGQACKGLTHAHMIHVSVDFSVKHESNQVQLAQGQRVHVQRQRQRVRLCMHFFLKLSDNV